MSASDDRRTTDADVTNALALWRRQEAAATVAAFPAVSDTSHWSEPARRIFVEALDVTERAIGRGIGVGDPLHSALSRFVGEAYAQGRRDFALDQPGVAATWDALDREASTLDERTQEKLARCYLRLCRVARAHEATRATRRRSVVVPMALHEADMAQHDALREGLLTAAAAWRLGELSDDDLERTVRALSHDVYSAGYQACEGVWRLAIQQWDDLDAEDDADSDDAIDG